MTKFLLGITLAFVSLLTSAKTIDFVIPYAPGGTADRIANVMLPFLKKELADYDLSPVITYRPGGGSIVGASSVAKSAPNRLQLLLTSNSVITAPIVNPQAIGYDIATDFVILDYLGHIPMLLVVNNNGSIKSIQDFQRLCRQKTLTYGSSGIGSATHMASAIVSDFLQCNATHIPYKGLGQAISDLQGNHVDFVSDFTASIAPHVDSGSFRAILVVDKHRHRDYTKIPSMSDIGYVDYNFYNWFVIMANANAPDSELSVVKSALSRLSKNSDLQQQLKDIGLQGANIPWDQQFLVRENSNFTKILKRVQK